LIYAPQRPHSRRDSIHLATAQLLSAQPGTNPLTFVTYDQRLLKAAEGIGLAIASPGV